MRWNRSLRTSERMKKKILCMLSSIPYQTLGMGTLRRNDWFFMGLFIERIVANSMIELLLSVFISNFASKEFSFLSFSLVARIKFKWNVSPCNYHQEPKVIHNRKRRPTWKSVYYKYINFRRFYSGCCCCSLRCYLIIFCCWILYLHKPNVRPQ